VDGGLVLGVPGDAGEAGGQGLLDLGVVGRVEAGGVEEGEIQVARRGRGPAMEVVPDQVAEDTTADQPVGRVDVAGGPQGLQQPGGRADQRREVVRQVGWDGYGQPPPAHWRAARRVWARGTVSGSLDGLPSAMRIEAQPGMFRLLLGSFQYSVSARWRAEPERMLGRRGSPGSG
jgi:hypothetical protein